jgi:hypothetical protein
MSDGAFREGGLSSGISIGTNRVSYFVVFVGTETANRAVSASVG